MQVFLTDFCGYCRVFVSSCYLLEILSTFTTRCKTNISVKIAAPRFQCSVISVIPLHNYWHTSS